MPPTDHPITVIYQDETAVRLVIRDQSITITLTDPQTGPRDVTVLEIAATYTANSEGPRRLERLVYVLDDRDHPLAFAEEDALTQPETWPAGVKEILAQYAPEDVG